MSQVLIRVVMLLATLLALVATSADASERVSLPAAWTMDGDELVWTSAAPLRMGGARYEFRSGQRVLGYPLQQGDTLRLRIAAGSRLVDLSVWAAGRRIDVSMPPTRFRRARSTRAATPSSAKSGKSRWQWLSIHMTIPPQAAASAL